MSEILDVSDVLPNHIILIRNAIKTMMVAEPMLKDIKGWHNVIASERGFGFPYGYVIFKQRNPIKEKHDIASFEYAYQFQIGIVVEFNSTNDNVIDDKALDLINLVESVLTKNGTLLGTADLDYFEKQLINEDLGFLPNKRHLALRVNYTNSVANET